MECGNRPHVKPSFHFDDFRDVSTAGSSSEALFTGIFTGFNQVPAHLLSRLIHLLPQSPPSELWSVHVLLPRPTWTPSDRGLITCLRARPQWRHEQQVSRVKFRVDEGVKEKKLGNSRDVHNGAAIQQQMITAAVRTLTNFRKDHRRSLPGRFLLKEKCHMTPVNQSYPLNWQQWR